MRALLALAVLGSALPAAAADLAPQDFAYARPIATPEKAAVYRFALPADVYGRTVRSDLGDLRVFNGRGEVVPYTLKRPAGDAAAAEADAGRAAAVCAQGKSRRRARGHSRHDRVRQGRRQSQYAGCTSQRHGHFELHRGCAPSRGVDRGRQPRVAGGCGEFAGRLKVEASDDLGAWRTLVEDAPIANLHADGARLIERRVEVPATRPKYLRLTWASAAPAVRPDRDQGRARGGTARQCRVSSSASWASRWRAAPASSSSISAGVCLWTASISSCPRPTASSISRSPRARKYRSRGSPRATRVLPSRDPQWRNAVGSGGYRHPRGSLLAGKSGCAGQWPWNGRPKLSVGWLAHELVFVARGAGPFQLAYGSGSAQPATAGLGGHPAGYPHRSRRGGRAHGSRWRSAPAGAASAAQLEEIRAVGGAPARRGAARVDGLPAVEAALIESVVLVSSERRVTCRRAAVVQGEKFRACECAASFHIAASLARPKRSLAAIVCELRPWI